MQATGVLAGGNKETTNLLKAVAEQLKVPLTTISRQVELSQLTGNVSPKDLEAIHTQASTALMLVECYLLGLELAHTQTALTLEPVSISAVLASTAHDLYYIAREHQVELAVQVAGKYEPVMANHKGVKAALLSLVYGFIESTASERGRRHLTLAVHRTSYGITAGVYGMYKNLEAQEWRNALRLCGQASQPFVALGADSGAGLFVADAILRAMTTKLRVGRHQKEAGLAATFQPSQQLAFV